MSGGLLSACFVRLYSCLSLVGSGMYSVTWVEIGDGNPSYNNKQCKGMFVKLE